MGREGGDKEDGEREGIGWMGREGGDRADGERG